ncbi:uncharacterized protein LOC113311482 [Papaver somniferum]|uniref:uncharacterized protein LOC113311482 n=1 Tax=Papaver somniferum TaxID=3469 RepID=UPI000E6F7864|nr:uncharacterized protein LOC113311482 [Papaver somniferum]
MARMDTSSRNASASQEIEVDYNYEQPSLRLLQSIKELLCKSREEGREEQRQIPVDHIPIPSQGVLGESLGLSHTTRNGKPTTVNNRFQESGHDDIVGEFNKLSQAGTVLDYQESFEELKALMLAKNRHLTEECFTYSFISGLKEELRMHVLMFSLKSLANVIYLSPMQEALLDLNAKKSKSSNRPLPIYTSNYNTHKNISSPITSPRLPKTFSASSSSSHTSKPPIKRLSYADMKARRDKGLCYNCDEVFSTGHKCVEQQVFMLAAEEDDTHNSLPPKISSLLDTYPKKFKEPTTLPPPRAHDHHIPLKPLASPPNQRPYIVPYVQKEVVENLVKEMLAAGVIQPSHSPFSSLIILVKKKDGSWRFCVDYRKLNDITVKDKYPIPIIEELLDELKGAKVFSKIDLRAGYHQIKVYPADVHKTAFRTHQGHYEFLVMPFGLTNAPACFQALMNDVFKTYLRKFILIFFDDILIYSPDMETHLQHLNTTLSLLQENSLFAKLSKCSLDNHKWSI